MVWYFIGVFIINRTLHGCLEIYKISLLALKKYFTCSLRSLVKYISTREEKFLISARPCNILQLFSLCFPRKQPGVILIIARGNPQTLAFSESPDIERPFFQKLKKCSKIAEKIRDAVYCFKKMITCKFLNISNSYEIIGIIM